MTFLQENTIFGDELANFLVGTTAQNTIFGLQGADTIVGSGSADFLYGNTDTDILYGLMDNDIIFGGKANDLIFGGKGNDSISGDRNDDTIYGDRGADTLTGGAGADVFAIGPGTGGLNVSEADWLVDFAVGEDSIQVIGGLTIEDLDIITNEGNTVIQDKTTGEILAVVQGVELQTPPPSNLPDPEIVQNAPVETIDPPISLPSMGTGTERPVTEDPGNTVEEALDIAGSSNGLIYREQVSQSDPDDFYAFSVGASSSLMLSLTRLNHNADLFLLDSAGNVIQSSEATKTADEFITQPLETGSYIIQVKAVDPETTDYNLNVTEISNLPGITTTGSDQVVELHTFESSRLIHLEPYIDDNNTSIQGFRNDPRFVGIDGRGFSTVILDSGIDLDHPRFGPDTDGNGVSDRIVYSYDFADNDADASDRDGHGSHVSSIIAGSYLNSRPEPGSQPEPQFITNQGMAPGANIIHLRVSGSPSTGTGGFSAVEQALKWVVAHAEEYNIASVNMSFGISVNLSEASELPNLGINDELAALKQKNVIAVASAGNDFFELGSVPGVNYPAADPSVLAVSATWDSNVGPKNFGGPIDYSTGASRITSFSQRDPNLTDIFAPGGVITGASADGSIFDASGTSQAAPHIAGIAVLAQQLAVQTLGRRLTFDEFRDLLRSTGDTINDGDDEDDNVTNTGFDYRQVNVLALGEGILNLASLENPAPPPPPLTQYNFVYLYDGAMGTSNESYSGYTYASPGTLMVGTLYDPLTAPNERGTNGAYFIASEQPAPSEALLGQVFVQKYTGNFIGGSSNTAVPYYFSAGIPSGSNGIGSEIDYVRKVGQQITFDLFGGDYFAANLPEIDLDPTIITL